MPSPDEIVRHLDTAIARLIAVDAYLLQADVNERSITHRLAMYLQDEFPEWHVDCEYNRDGHETKRVTGLPGRTAAGPEDTDGSRVFPDIIVHRRDSEDNLLVIEAKKASSRVPLDHDRLKLRAYHEQLRYRYAALLTLDGDTLDVGIEWV